MSQVTTQNQRRRSETVAPRRRGDGQAHRDELAQLAATAPVLLQLPDLFPNETGHVTSQPSMAVVAPQTPAPTEPTPTEPTPIEPTPHGTIPPEATADQPDADEPVAGEPLSPSQTGHDQTGHYQTVYGDTQTTGYETATWQTLESSEPAIGAAKVESPADPRLHPPVPDAGQDPAEGTASTISIPTWPIRGRQESAGPINDRPTSATPASTTVAMTTTDVATSTDVATTQALATPALATPDTGVESAENSEGTSHDESSTDGFSTADTLPWQRESESSPSGVIADWTQFGGRLFVGLLSTLLVAALAWSIWGGEEAAPEVTDPLSNPVVADEGDQEQGEIDGSSTASDVGTSLAMEPVAEQDAASTPPLGGLQATPVVNADPYVTTASGVIPAEPADEDIDTFTIRTLRPSKTNTQEDFHSRDVRVGQPTEQYNDSIYR